MIKYFTTNRKKGSEAGFSLLELLLVVGVGALLLLAGIATYRLVTGGNNVNDAVRVLTTIKQQTQRAFQGQRSYTDQDLIPTLVNMEAFPAGVLDGSNVPHHPWGGEIEITGDDQQFIITFNDVPSDACIQLGTTFNEEDTDFVSLDVDGDTYEEGGSTIDANAMASSCGTNTRVPMTWTFF